MKHINKYTAFLEKQILLFLLTIAFCVGYFNVMGQTIINLKYEEEKGGMPYSFVNISDSQYLHISYDEDMGARSSFRYEFNNNIPDGDYIVYVNKKLGAKGNYKNGKKEGEWHQYSENGHHNITTYKNGLEDGMSHWYLTNGEHQMTPYKNGKLSGRGEIIDSVGNVSKVVCWNNGNTIRTYFENNKITIRQYYITVNGVSQEMRREYYTADNNLKEVVDFAYTNGVGAEYAIPLKSLQLNGNEIYKFPYGTFHIKYKSNRIIEYSFYDADGKLLTKEGNQGL